MKQSVEKLVHFQCDTCFKWWSIGDAPEEKLSWYCPWCGHLHQLGSIKVVPLSIEQVIEAYKATAKSLNPNLPQRINAISPDAGMPQRGVK